MTSLAILLTLLLIRLLSSKKSGVARLHFPLSRFYPSPEGHSAANSIGDVFL